MQLRISATFPSLNPTAAGGAEISFSPALKLCRPASASERFSSSATAFAPLVSRSWEPPSSRVSIAGTAGRSSASAGPAAAAADDFANDSARWLQAGDVKMAGAATTLLCGNTVEGDGAPAPTTAALASSFFAACATADDAIGLLARALELFAAPPF